MPTSPQPKILVFALPKPVHSTAFPSGGGSDSDSGSSIPIPDPIGGRKVGCTIL